MAPWQKVRTAHVAAHVQTQRASWDQLSAQEDSGRRVVSESHAHTLNAVVMQGDFGCTMLAKPSVLVDQHELAVLSNIGGDMVLDNGTQ